MDLESVFAIVFILCLIIFLYAKRDKIKVQKLIFPLLYFILYRTKVGIKLMDKVANKARKFLHYLTYLVITVGFVGMIFISYALIKNIYIIFTEPSAMPGVGVVLPIEAKGVFYVPFFYWIISIFILAVAHEFSHGLFAKTFRMRVKSSGLAFLAVLVPILPAAFVEPDEKQLSKRPAFQQLGVFAAGSFANIVLGIIFMLIFMLVLQPVLTSVIAADGVKIMSVAEDEDITYPAEIAGISAGEVIHRVDGIEVKYQENFTSIMGTTKSGDYIKIVTDRAEYSFQLATNPQNSSRGYIGITSMQNRVINQDFSEKYGKFTAEVIMWFTLRPSNDQVGFIPGLIYWLYLLNIGIGLFNLAPLGPIDGGRMLHVVLQKVCKKKTADKIWKITSLVFLIIVLVNVGFAFVR